MLTKLFSFISFLILALTLKAESKDHSNSNQFFIQTSELNSTFLPSFMTPLKTESNVIENVKYAEIRITAQSKGERTLHFNGTAFYEIKIWVVENDTISSVLHYGSNIKKYPEKRNEGIKIPLSFEASETKRIYYTIYDLGVIFNDSFSLEDNDKLERIIRSEIAIKTICRSILGLFLFIGLCLGYFLRKKVLLYYVIFSFTGLLYTESQFGIILHHSPSYFHIKLVQFLTLQLYFYFYIFFYYSLLFNSKGVNRKFIKSIKVYFSLMPIVFLAYALIPEYLTNISNTYLIFGHISFLLTYLFIGFLLIRGIYLKLPIAKATLFIFLVNLFVVFLPAIFSQFNLFPNYKISHFIFYCLFAFDSIYYIVIMLYKYYKLRQERKTLLMKYNSLQRDYSLALMEGQETEKNRIGRELHDHIGGNLAMIDKMDNIIQNDSNAILSDTIVSLEDMIKSLSPNAKKRNHFTEELGQLFIKYSKSYFNLHVTLNISTLNSPFVQSQLLRISQELLINAVKHSHAENVYFDYQFNPFTNSLNLYYKDDGIGFIPELEKDGVGLKNMRYRVEKVNGIMKVESNENGVQIDFINIQLNNTTEKTTT
ncbi:hypothetical protein [Flammeovirga sp. SJP92]|uniref:sensor histidine kinase n=1 Tax=Flammeovirga sp. SJP92 TaxID=1775430 RepID=UPI0007897BA7|nr:hypothetical protein [Flammeovirga sp. SJP92]KXX66577.1 hypothetical protein AVL50_31265 [Flammeovirga sp. SJP92]